MRLGAVTACVAADGFFADAERRPVFGALAQVTPPACDNVGVASNRAAAAASSSSFSSAPGAVPAPTSRGAPRGRRCMDPRRHSRARGGDVNVTVGARRLLSSRRRGDDDEEKSGDSPPGDSPHELGLASKPRAAPRRGGGRRGPPRGRRVRPRDVLARSPRSTQNHRGTPTDVPGREARDDLTRFAEVDPASPMIGHAEISATIGGGEGDATTTTFRRACTVAPRRGAKTLTREGGTDTAAIRTIGKGRIGSGVNVAGDGLNLAERVRACAHRGPPSRPLRTAASTEGGGARRHRAAVQGRG